MALKFLHRGYLEWHYLQPNFMKIYGAVQKLLVGNTQTDRQTDWLLDKSTFIFVKQAKNRVLFNTDSDYKYN
jgi:hypothetical protein